MSEDRTFWLMGDRIQVIHSGPDYGLLHAVTIPNSPMAPLRCIVEAATLFHVLDGEFDVWSDGEWRTLGRGESVRIEKGVPHNTRNSSDREVTWLCCLSPGGFERFIMEYGVPATEEKACERSFSEQVVTRLVANCGKYGMKLPEIDFPR